MGKIIAIANQKGGVVKRNPGKPSQDILHDTLESGGVVLNVISDGSLKCFVIEIIINDPAACEYIDTNVTGSFRNPVERLVMKILITDDHPGATFTNDGTISNADGSSYCGIGIINGTISGTIDTQCPPP
jgi:hypothetical protein